MKKIILLLVSSFILRSISAQFPIFKHVSAGYFHQIAIAKDGTLWTWGRYVGYPKNYYCPTQISCDTTWGKIVAGLDFNLALKNDGTLWAWGNNNYGQLGDSTLNSFYDYPKLISNDTNWMDIYAGGRHSLALKSDSTLWGWGDGLYGQMGNGTTSGYLKPTQLGADTNWSAICAGVHHTLALKNNGTLWAWGRNNNGQVGDGTGSGLKLNKLQIGAANTWYKIAAGQWHSMALRKDSTLYCWGSNASGEIGNGTTVQRNSPLKIGTDTTWVAISGGINTSYALKLNGSFWSWGENTNRQLCNGGSSDLLVPTLNSNFTNILQFDAGLSVISTVLKNNNIISGGNFVGLPGNCNLSSSMYANPFQLNTPFENASIPSSTIDSVYVIQNDTNYYSDNCINLICKIVSSGSQPLQCGTKAKVWIDTIQPTTYVKRHYEITPENNPNNATATVTLYFTQDEFIDYNTLNTNLPLPTSSNDSAGKSNIRIEKIGGVSINFTGHPSSYSGDTTLIDPIDSNIVWNSVESRWEITFDVSGFSGFFLKSLPLVPLTISQIILTGNKIENGNQLIWMTNSQKKLSHFLVQRIEENQFKRIGIINLNENPTINKNLSHYSFIDLKPLNGINYYRIQEIDINGVINNSNILQLNNLANLEYIIYPNPSSINQFFVISKFNEAYQLYDFTGKIIQQGNISIGENTIDACNLPIGMYLLRIGNQTYKIIKQ